jgi:hypothetical protein
MRATCIVVEVAGVTVIETVAGLLSTVTSFALKVKLSAPL